MKQTPLPMSNPNIHDGRSGEYRRRSHAAYPSNAIEAAERAASYILSDGPIANIKKTVRNRSSSGNSGNINVVAENSSNNKRATINSNSGNSGSFLLRMQRQREALMQRQRRERAFSVKMTAWVLLFVMGSLFLFGGGEQQNQEQRNLDHKKKRRGGGKNAKNIMNKEKVGVPLPPNVERQHLQEKTAGRIKKQHNSNKELEEQYTEQLKQPLKVVSIGDDAAIQDSMEAYSQHRAIPSILIFTYHTNLLSTPEADLADEEDIALSKNIQHIISLHPSHKVRFLNDNDCLESIRNSLGPDTNLTTYFTNEERGMYKADICRGAALYETGGLYFDVDIEARMSLWDVISPKTEFVTTYVHKDSNHIGGFFQAFIGVTRGHAIMKKYLELFVRYYEGTLPAEVNGPLGVYLLRIAYTSVVGKHPDPEDEATIDLWQEVRWTPELFPDIQREKWGERRACQMLVVAPAVNTDQFQRKQMVPFFSHANGSRMCGGKDTNKKG